MKVANIQATVLTKEQSQVLKLKDEQYLVIIPKKLFNKLGITKSEFTFDLISDKDKVSLVVNRLARKLETEPTEELYNEWDKTTI